MNAGGTRGRRLALRVALIGLAGITALSLVGCGSQLFDSYGDDADGVMSSPDMAVESMSAEERSGAMPVPDPGFPPDGSGQDASEVPADERFVIRTVGLRIQVEDVEAAVDSLREEVDRVDGIVTGLHVSTDDDTPIYRYEALGSLADGAPLKGYVTVRVPADELPAFLERVGGLGEVLRQSSDESDVTQEHIDLSARLENLDSQEERLREFFDRAETVEEMLDIERELGRVRGEIESLKARIAYIERQTAMATVTIELAGELPVIRPSGTDWGFVDAITTGIRGLVGTINAMIILAMSLLPIVVTGLVVWLIVRAILRKRKARRTPASESFPIGETPADSADEGVHE